jgi:hypothetical protein
VVRFRLPTLFLAVAVIALFALAAKRFNDWDHQLKAEYATAGVIRDVTQFVESHKGQWPKSWDDIPDGNSCRHYVRMRFDVKTDDLVADPNLIQSAIAPASGVYHTYPHAERQLNQLRDVLVRFHDK